VRSHYQFSYWDSLIIASALETGCSILFSEDMQDGQVIESTLTIRNPLIESAPA
jgi:predicted nucleic acid-binding protein